MKEEIKRIKTLMNLNENKQVYDYGCVMLYFNDDNIKEMYGKINPEDLYVEGDGFGLETEPHCTLLYGLHPEVTLEDIESVLDNYTYYTCKAHNLSIFENELYDVLKYDIKGDGLRQTNEELKTFPYTSNYPNYNPHMTIAYLKPGKGKEYVENLTKEYSELLMSPQHVVYSTNDGTKNKINVRID